MVNSVITWIV